MKRIRPGGYRRTIVIFLVALVAILGVGCQSDFERREWTAVPAEDMERLLDLYDLERQLGWTRELTSPDYGGREAGTENEDLAGDYLVEQLQALGLAPWREVGFEDYRHTFDLPRGAEPGENIIAVLPGESEDNYLLIGAHYDHIGIVDGVLHPGADDNAVGTATVLELAHIFCESELTPELSIVFVFFGGEEKGLIGSQALAEHLVDLGLDDQVMLLNLDVIAGASGDTLVIFDGGQRRNRVWAEKALEEAVASGVKAVVSDRLAGGVDSMRFTEVDMPAITLVWGELRADHPYLHQPTDTFENLNREIIELATRAAIRIAWTYAMK